MLNFITKILKRYYQKARKAFVPEPISDEIGSKYQDLGALAAFYRRGFETIDRLLASQDWNQLLDAFEQFAPPKAILMMIALGPKTKSSGHYHSIRFLEHFEYKLNECISKLDHCMEVTDDKIRIHLLRDYQKSFLKILYRHSPRMERYRQSQLANYIAQDGDSQSIWLQYGLAHLEDVDTISDRFLSSWNTHFAMDCLEPIIRQDDLEHKSKRAMIALANAQAALTANKQLSHSGLTLARIQSLIDLKKSDHPSLVGPTAEDDYIEWLIETAVKHGAAPSADDSLCVARSKFAKNDFHGVLRLITDLSSMNQKQTLECRKLLAISHGQLWMQRSTEGNVDYAIDLLNALDREQFLDSNERFLFCELMVRAGKIDQAAALFESLNFGQIKANPETVAEMACQVGQLPLIDKYLREAIDAVPSSTLLLSVFCQHLRVNLKDIKTSDEIISRIETLDQSHSWAVVAQCNRKLGSKDFFQVPNLLMKLPEHSFWRVEKGLIATRYHLARGDMVSVKRHFVDLREVDRPDKLYIQCLILAHEKDFNQALSSLPNPSECGSLAESVAELKVKLQMALHLDNEALKNASELSKGKQKDVLPWIHLRLGNHSKVIQLASDKPDPEKLVALSIAHEKSGRIGEAIKGYEAFIDRVEKTHPMFSFAAHRYTSAVIKTHDKERAAKILQKNDFVECLGKDVLIDLLIARKDWDKILDLIKKPESENQKHHLCFALFQKIKNSIQREAWDIARKGIKELGRYNPDEAHSLGAVLEQMQWLDKLRTSSVPLTNNIPEDLQTGPVGLHYSLNSLFAGRISLNDFRNRLNDAGISEDSHPKTALLILILPILVGSDTNKIDPDELKRTLAAQKDPDLVLVGQAIAGLSGTMVPNWAALLDRMDNLKGAIPIHWEDFWRALAQLAASDTAGRPDIAVKILEKANIPPGPLTTAIYAHKAKQSLKLGDELAAINELERAIAI